MKLTTFHQRFLLTITIVICLSWCLPLTKASKDGEDSVKTSPIADHFEERWFHGHHFEKESYNRFAKSHSVDYGGNHPFEVLERRRLLERNQTLEVTDNRSLQNPWAEDAVYYPLRITFDMTYLQVMKDNAKYSEHYQVLNTEILPKVRDTWRNALRVFRPAGNIKIQNNQCPNSSNEQVTVGVPNTDLVIFVAANFDIICKDKRARAAARSCQADQYDRPTVGSVILCLDRLNVQDEVSKHAFYTTIIHEMTHVLGMRAIDFPYYYDHTTGKPRTPRPLQQKTVTCVDGNVVRLQAPSLDTLKTGYTKRGKLFYEVVTPNVRQIARNHFDCQNMAGARLENIPTNDGNCFGSHWEARLFATDTVAAIKIPIMQMLTPLTLGVLEDSGWYKAQYENSQMSPFGHGKGCDFVYDDCIINGQIPEWSKGTFCNDLSGPQSPPRCDLSHQYITRCDLVDFDDYPNSKPPDRNHQYFPNQPVSTYMMSTSTIIFRIRITHNYKFRF